MQMGNIYLDANAIYRAGTKAIKGSNFKHATQLFEINHLLYTAMIQQSLINKTYRPTTGRRFTISERGKARLITSNTMTDKVVNHVICDEILTPYLNKFLIYDNGASQKGKGVSFSRKRFEIHLRKYFARHGTNDGYILLGDFSKYYANIPHDKAYNVLEHFLTRTVKDPEEVSYTLHLIKMIFETFGGDKGIDIGNQISQNIGILYPYRFDNCVKITSGIKEYGRYTDDFYAISDSKEVLINLLTKLRSIAAEFGIKINERKTRIVKLTAFYRYLQNGNSLLDTGRVIRKISPKAITRERRKLKAYKRLLIKGIMTYQEIQNAYKGWLCGNYKRMSWRQIFNINSLFTFLFRGNILWQRNYSQLRWLTEHRSAIWNSTGTTLSAKRRNLRPKLLMAS